MKLRNKLIPLISAASAAATIAPIALTSCSAGMVNLIGGYRPTIAKAVWEDNKSNKKDMLAFYMSAVNENSEILAQDLYWKYATEAYYDLDEESWFAVKVNNFQAKVSNVVVRKLTCDYKDGTTTKSVDYYTLSLDYIINTSYSATVGYVQSMNTVMNVSVKNIPVTINREGTCATKDIPWYIPWSISKLLQVLDDSFTEGFLPTSWVIQPMLDLKIELDEETFSVDMTIDHTPFKHLEDNGYDWFVKANMTATQEEIQPQTGEKEISNYDLNFELNKDSQFVKAQEAIDKYLATGDEPQSLELMMAEEIYQWYLPSFYLSDIVDTENQLWKEAE